MAIFGRGKKYNWNYVVEIKGADFGCVQTITGKNYDHALKRNGMKKADVELVNSYYAE